MDTLLRDQEPIYVSSQSLLLRRNIEGMRSIFGLYSRADFNSVIGIQDRG